MNKSKLSPSLAYVGAGISDSSVIVDRNIKEDFNYIKKKVTNVVNTTIDLTRKSVEIISKELKENEDE